MKRALGVKKVRLAGEDELREEFGAQPGAAYPFGFAPAVPILIDPAIYDEEWLLFSAALPTVTLQIRGTDLRAVFDSLPNPTYEPEPATTSVEDRREQR